MKSYTILAILFLFNLKVLGCDICGCSVSGSYFGLLPQYRKHFIGLRTNLRTIEVKHPPLFAGEKTVYSNDLAFSTEMWGKYQLNNKLQIIGILPYQFNERKEEGIHLKHNGLGDISLSLIYKVWSTPDSNQNSFKQSILIGGGLKIPTGKYFNTVVYNGLILPGFQTGTASWDIPVNFLYTIKRKSLGLNTEMTYQFNTTNRYGYQFGNRFSSAIRLFYWKYKPLLSILPQAGFSYENYAQDKKENVLVRYTGGSSVWSFAGIDLYKGRWGIGLNTWYPIYQNVGEKHIKMLPRLTTNFLFLF